MKSCSRMKKFMVVDRRCHHHMRVATTALEVLPPYHNLQEGLVNAPKVGESAVEVPEVDGRSRQRTASGWKFLSLHRKLTDGGAVAPKCHCHTGRASAEPELDGKSVNILKVERMCYHLNQKLPEGLIDTPEVDESAVQASGVDGRSFRWFRSGWKVSPMLWKWTEGAVPSVSTKVARRSRQCIGNGQKCHECVGS